MSLAGMRVLAFESRRGVEIAELIRRQQGDPFVAPSLREAPLESNTEAYAFAERLAAGAFDMMILLTGVGTRALARLLEGRCDLAGELRKIAVVARGPKPAAALRELQVPVTVAVPEPNTWRELLVAIEGRPERRIAIQEYGRPAAGLAAALRARGCQVTPVRVYQYALPEDTQPLREAARRLAQGRADVTLFTTAVQIVHLAELARSLGCEAQTLEGVRRTVVASIGPATSEALDEFGIQPDVIPSHPKMGFLVQEAAQQAPDILARKRGR
jgi:uroporphyrinogen-III synthase